MKSWAAMSELDSPSAASLATWASWGVSAFRSDRELPEHFVQVILHRARADEELGGDVGVGFAVGGELGHLGLLGRERVQIGPRASGTLCAGDTPPCSG